MKQLELEVSKREITGKKVRFLRREGTLPVNLYGSGIKSMPLQVDNKSVKQVLSQAGKTDLITLKIAGTKTPRKVLIREVQINRLTDELLHIDFYQVKMTEKIKTDVPLVFTGEAPVLKSNKNSSLLRLISALTIEALPDALPHSFEVDVSNIEDINQAIHVKDINLGEGVTLVGDPEQMIIKVTETRREAETEEGEVEVKEEAAEMTAQPKAVTEPKAEADV